MRSYCWHAAARRASAVVLSFALVWSGVPAAALAEALGGEEVAQEQTEDGAGGEDTEGAAEEATGAAGDGAADEAGTDDAPEDAAASGFEAKDDEADAYALAYREENGEAVLVGYARINDEGQVEAEVDEETPGLLTAMADGYTLSEPQSFEPNLVIPSRLGGLTVTAVGDSAFEDAGWLETVELPSTCAKVGGAAFRGCAELREVRLPKGLKSV